MAIRTTRPMRTPSSRSHPAERNRSPGDSNSTKPAFTIAAGWGNTIPRNGGHWSFPFEVGVALTGPPLLNANLTGWACNDQAQTQCTNVASTTDPNALQIQGDLATQISKWKNDLNPLKTYPIISIGTAYSFGMRGGAR